MTMLQRIRDKYFSKKNSKKGDEEDASAEDCVMTGKERIASSIAQQAIEQRIAEQKAKAEVQRMIRDASRK